MAMLFKSILYRVFKDKKAATKEWAYACIT